MKKNIKASWSYKVYPVCSITLVTSYSIMIKTLVVIKFGEIVFLNILGILKCTCSRNPDDHKCFTLCTVKAFKPVMKQANAYNSSIEYSKCPIQ